MIETSGQDLLVVDSPPLPSLGQATAIEQSRAVAEVQAAIFMARQFPRDEVTCHERMRVMCADLKLAEKAFWSYPRGKDERGRPNIISGSTVQLARALAQCWGNMQHGVQELRRDDDTGESEMLAVAWDLERNVRTSSIWVVPHGIDSKTGRIKLTEIREVYENNANQGARRLRQAIVNVLPPAFVTEAEDLCRKTLTKGVNTKSPAMLVADYVALFGKLGVTRAQLEERVGRPSKDWTEPDFVQLHTLGLSLQRGEISREEAFPAPVLTVEDLPPRKAAGKPAEPMVITETPPDEVWPKTAQPGGGDG